MIKIKDVEYRLANFGPQNGHPQVVLTFEKAEGDWDPEDKNHYSLYADFKKLVEDKGFEKFYLRAINGSLETYLLFSGADILLKENRGQWDEFYSNISSESLELQKSYIKAGDKNISQLRPPFMIWTGPASYFSGNENVYEYFNIPYVVLDADSEYTQLALQQIMNHTFGKVYINWTDAEKTKKFIAEIREAYNDYKSVIISDIEHREEAMVYCLENGFVYYTYHD